MVIPRAPLRRTTQLLSQSLCATRNTPKTRSWQLVQRRTYAGSSEEGNYRGDIPWAIGAVAVTVPSVWYLVSQRQQRLRDKAEKGHGDAKHGEHNKESKSEKEKSLGGEDNKGEGEKDVGTKDSEEKSNDSDTEGEGQQDTPEASSDESEDAAHKKKQDGENDEGLNKENIGGDDSKVVTDKDNAADNDSHDSNDKQSGEQESVSDTNAQHSEYHASKPEMSQKSGGALETSKAKGTVKPKDQNP